ncbi:MAG: DUF4290 domain-containing protein [Flavobacteriales bacterium]|nr:DUF4290 domain-containing protein [Flavobacteriales bacterium]MCZ2443046.1 DUF4290 domain-containing protein [Flavobacteriales bacterium]
MDYNSQRKKLLLPEYGRNIQNMIWHIIEIEDREERNKAARTIISVMASTNPNYKDIEDFNHKLWDHLFAISDYRLDVDSPFPKPERPEAKQTPHLFYPQKPIRFRHYGKNLQYFIEKARAVEDLEIKEKFVEALANLMKKSYLTWNRDSVDNDLIINQLKEMSNGELVFNEANSKMTSTQDILGMNKKKPQQPIQGKNFKKGGKKFKKHFNNPQGGQFSSQPRPQNSAPRNKPDNQKPNNP